MTFLSTVAKLERYQVIFKNLFNNDEAIKQFCEKIVLPNMYFRGEYIDLILFIYLIYRKENILFINDIKIYIYTYIDLKYSC